jgi:hypothetical protein
MVFSPAPPLRGAVFSPPRSPPEGGCQAASERSGIGPKTARWGSVAGVLPRAPPEGGCVGQALSGENRASIVARPAGVQVPLRSSGRKLRSIPPCRIEALPSIHTWERRPRLAAELVHRGRSIPRGGRREPAYSTSVCPVTGVPLMPS